MYKVSQLERTVKRRVRALLAGPLSVAKRITSLSSALPLAIVLLTSYATYVYCYLFCWKELGSQNLESRALYCITHYCLLLVIVAIIWSRIIIIGPGSVPRVPQYELTNSTSHVSPDRFTKEALDEEAYCLNPLPRVFACDFDGYPLWCSICQSVKPDRVHHSVELGHCVPRMDHYCIWINSIIGGNNHRLFIQYVFYWNVLVLFTTLTLACHLRRNYSTSNLYHFIVLLGIGFAWLIFLSGTLFYHVMYILCNKTTIEALQSDRQESLFFNFRALDGMRVVIHLHSGDPLPYDSGKLKNWKAIMGSTPLHWFIPLTTRSRLIRDEYREVVSERLLYSFQQKYMKGERGRLAYPHLQRTSKGTSLYSEEKLSNWEHQVLLPAFTIPLYCIWDCWSSFTQSNLSLNYWYIHLLSSILINVLK